MLCLRIAQLVRARALVPSRHGARTAMLRYGLSLLTRCVLHHPLTT